VWLLGGLLRQQATQAELLGASEYRRGKDDVGKPDTQMRYEDATSWTATTDAASRRRTRPRRALAPKQLADCGVRIRVAGESRS
jgi:hypothetical protein